MRFKWIDWNRAHIARHDVRVTEVEEVLLAETTSHRVRRDGTVVSRGYTRSGRRLHVVWREDEEPDLFADIESMIFVITAYEV